MSDPFASFKDSWPLGRPPAIGDPLPLRMSALTIRRDQYGPPSRNVRMEYILTPRLRVGDAKRVLVSILATGPNFNTNFASLGLPVPVFGKGDPATLHVPGSDGSPKMLPIAHWPVALPFLTSMAATRWSGSGPL